ncbi:MAG: hypothetical protein HC922_07110 [Leptolyngbyaceae cyanobacterium SM2_3_12]|nr:hypothetical protein [Leptolyngbyaceae cyanobacterium SM2_3_12]
MVDQTKVGIFSCLVTLGMVGPGQAFLTTHAEVARPDQSGLFALKVASFSAQADWQTAQTEPPPDPVAPTTTGSVLLAPGTESADVMVLQRQMKLSGLYTGPINGIYGESTQAAVAAFQETVELPATGILTQATWEQMITPQLLASDPAPEGSEPSPNLLSGQDAVPATAPEPLPSQGNASDQDQEDPGAVAVEASPAPHSWPWGWLAGSLALALGGMGLGWLGHQQQKRRKPSPESHFPKADGAIAANPSMPPETGNPLPPTPSLNDPIVADPLAPRPASSPGVEPALANSASESDLPALSETTRLGRTHLVETLIEELTNPDAAQRHRAIWELGQRGNSTAVQPLVEGLIDADSKERSLILAALVEINSRSLQPMNRALAISLQDQSPEVRKNAIRDLSRIYDLAIQLSQMLAQAAQDPHPEVQATALWALEQLNRVRLTPDPSVQGLAPDLTPTPHSLSQTPPHSSS